VVRSQISLEGLFSLRRLQVKTCIDRSRADRWLEQSVSSILAALVDGKICMIALHP
jgi:hypothetical protein